MSEFVSKNQCYIESKKARAVGKKGMAADTSEILNDFFDAICKHVLSADDDVFVIQWAVIKLDDDERKKLEQM